MCDQADALELEERQHASYRRSRGLGVYLGGEGYIEKLEKMDRYRPAEDPDHRRIRSRQKRPNRQLDGGPRPEPIQRDFLYAHHLGCSNDASAIRPMLARLIETA